MIYSTTETIPGRDIIQSIKSIVGGEIRGYTEMLNEARDIAITRLVESAEQKGADAVVGIRFTTSAIMDGSCEILAFGTAVKLQ
jgi:uncharacterized protein YbjQ (UPF0145 family)